MKNKNIKTFFYTGLLTALLQAIVTAGYYLPESTLWQGARNYQDADAGINAYVEYAVYDSSAGLPAGIVHQGSGQYVYAYQIFNLGTGYDPITTFKLLGGDPSAASGIGYQNDGQGGLVPLNDGESFLWRFGLGEFVAYEHSAFLIFSSDSLPIAGTLSISNTLDDYGNEPPINGDEVITESIPEPATLTMLTIGAFFKFRKKLYVKHS